MPSWSFLEGLEDPEAVLGDLFVLVRELKHSTIRAVDLITGALGRNQAKRHKRIEDMCTACGGMDRGQTHSRWRGGSGLEAVKDAEGGLRHRGLLVALSPRLRCSAACEGVNMLCTLATAQVRGLVVTTTGRKH